MRFIKTICLVLCLLILAQPIFAAETDVTVTSGCRTVDAGYALGGGEKLVETTQAAILYERSTGTLLYAYNADARIYPSSMVKLMTALVALDNASLSEEVTVTRSALNTVEIGSVSAGLKAGEKISLEALLYCMMVSSANDAAAVIAEYIGGNQAGFVDLMNQKAEELGCRDTHFSNATGLHDEQTYTTARDVLRILEVGLANDAFAAMFCCKEYTVSQTNESEERTITTTNDMMLKTKYRDDRVTGGKTGATEQAGRCLAVTAEVGNMELVGIVMGAAAEYEESGLALTVNYSFMEMSQLLDHAEDTFTCSQLFFVGQVLDRYAVTNGANDVAVMPADEARCVLPVTATATDLIWEHSKSVGLTAPVSKGQTVADITVWYNGICLAQTDLVAMTDVGIYQAYEVPGGEDDQEEIHGQILATILGVIAGIAVLIFVAMLLIRAINTAMLKARVRRRRRNRRRNRHV